MFSFSRDVTVQIPYQKINVLEYGMASVWAAATPKPFCFHRCF